MIISASRRTDLPAFFPKETIEKIVSMNDSEQKTLFKKNIVDAVVFWTKNAKPILPYLNELDDLKIPYYFQYTMNDYPGLEPNIPNYWDRVRTFISLSEMIGKSRIIWRYDPFLTSILPVEYTVQDDLKRFEFMGHCLCKYTEKLVFSFLDPYDKIPTGISAPTKEEERIIIDKIVDLNKLWKLELASCAENIDNLSIKRNRCIDPELLMRIGVEISKPSLKDYSQRKICDCYPSKEIGTYHTCKHNCIYCYSR